MVVKEILQRNSTDLPEKNMVAVDYCVLNNGKTPEVIHLMRESQMHALKPERVIVIEDQIIPPNSPEVSAAQQRVMEFAEAEQTEYHYGVGMASYILLNQYINPGDVVVSGDRDILMAGARGALGICLGSAKLAQAVVYGKAIIPEPDIFRVALTGQLKPETDIRAAAMLLVEALAKKVTPTTVIEFYLTGETRLSQDESGILCGWMQKTGALSALMVSAFSQAADLSFDLGAAGQPLVPAANPEAVKVVFIGGAYGGLLTDIGKAADQLRGKQLAYKVRLVVAPATAEIYAAAADKGYLADIMAAGGMVINQCGNPAVQARIGENEIMVSNDIHDEAGYAGPDTAKIYLTTTNQAIQCALRGIIGNAAGAEGGRP